MRDKEAHEEYMENNCHDAGKGEYNASIRGEKFEIKIEGKCPECQKENLILDDSGEIYCKDCGLVLDQWPS